MQVTAPTMQPPTGGRLQVRGYSCPLLVGVICKGQCSRPQEGGRPQRRRALFWSLLLLCPTCNTCILAAPKLLHRQRACLCTFTTAFNMAAHFIRTHVAALKDSCGRLHRKRSCTPVQRNAGDSLRTPGSQHQLRKPSLAQTTYPGASGSNPHPAHMRWPAPSLGLRLAGWCDGVYHTNPCLQKRSGTSHRMLRHQ